MKKLLIIPSVLLMLASTGAGAVSANTKCTCPCTRRHTRTVRVIRPADSKAKQNKRKHPIYKPSKKELDNAISVMSIQLGTSRKSLDNLHRNMPKMSYKKTVRLCEIDMKMYRQINHKNFDFNYWK